MFYHTPLLNLSFIQLQSRITLSKVDRHSNVNCGPLTLNLMGKKWDYLMLQAKWEARNVYITVYQQRLCCLVSGQSDVTSVQDQRIIGPSATSENCIDLYHLLWFIPCIPNEVWRGVYKSWNGWLLDWSVSGSVEPVNSTVFDGLNWSFVHMVNIV